METSKENIYANNKILIEAANIGRFMQVCNMVAIADGGEPIFGGEKLLKESPRKFFALIAPRVKKNLATELPEVQSVRARYDELLAAVGGWDGLPNEFPPFCELAFEAGGYLEAVFLATTVSEF